MISADILTAFFIGLAFVVAYVVLTAAGRKLADKRARLVEPEEDCGDQGGMPMPHEPGDEFYASRRAGGMDNGR